MDIFTTQLTRVVPVPIKPANLKVKALLKEAKTSKLKEDPDHLENHDYYFDKNNVDENGTNENNKNKEKPDDPEKHLSTEVTESKAVKLVDKEQTVNENKEECASKSAEGVITKGKDGKKHLDFYV